ncbi:MAG: right-handed parallel beta-helix repeat-containing protein [Actinomycetota bacterium]|nr:right-handed parallel beta-helix repeat-containing protein [Actinomycetota bacterium]
MTRRGGIVLAVVLAVVGALGVPTPAHATHLSCGQTITTNTTLDSDIGPCTNFGLIVGANGITLDLNGHRIFGTSAVNDKAGVYLLNRVGVTVRNGTLTDFDIGVAIEGGSRNLVTGVNAQHNIGGAGGIGGDGIALLSTRNNAISGNRTVDNGPFSGIGIYSRVDSDHPRATSGPSQGNVIDGNYVFGNIISRNRVNPTGTDNDGIRMENDAAFNTLSNNQVLRNGLDGIALFADTADNTVRGNQVEGNGFYRTTARRGSGIIVFSRSTRNLVENNLSVRNADSGIDIRPPVGTSVGALNNSILNNTAVNNSALPFIPSPVFGPSFDLKDGNVNPPCDNNTWFGNRYRTFNQPCVTAGGQQI